MIVTPARNIHAFERPLVAAEIASGAAYHRADGSLKAPQEIARLLTTKPLVDNPEAQPQVYVALDKQALLSLILPQVGSFSDEALIRVSDALDRGDRETIGMWLKIALARNWIPQSLHDQLQAAVFATEPDPAWQAKVPGQSPLERVLGRPAGISPEEVLEITRG